MNRSLLAKIYATALIALYFAGGLFLVCLSAFSSDWEELLFVIEGLAVSLIAAPIIHEVGHIVFASRAKMQTVYSKFFCVKVERRGGRYAFSLANPLKTDETQAVPTCGGEMKKRLEKYTLGGLIFEGAYLLIVLVGAILLSAFGIYSGKLWGMVPYTAYHFLLNVAPFEYPTGKADGLIYHELKKNEPSARLMASVMDLQGRIYAGERYSEIEETAFDFPVVAEDDPAFVSALELKYRRALEKEDFETAGKILLRASSCEDYLSEETAQKIASEMVYLYTLLGEREQANECAKRCVEYLKSEQVSAKRILATVAYCDGRLEECSVIKNQAKALLEKEEKVGDRLFEEKMLSTLKDEEGVEDVRE